MMSITEETNVAAQYSYSVQTKGEMNSGGGGASAPGPEK